MQDEFNADYPQQFNQEGERRPPPPASGGSGVLKWILIGCGGIAVLMLGCTVFVAIKAKSLLATGVESGMERMLQDMGVPDAEREQIMKPVREFTDRIRNGEVDLEQGLGVLAALTKGPMLNVFMVYVFEAKYLKPSGLSEEEKAAGHVTAWRFADGVIKETIPEDRRKEAMSYILDESVGPDDQPKFELKEQVSDEDLRKALALMKKAADDAGVPAEVPEVDMAAEIRKAIEQGMSGASKSRAAPTSSPPPSPPREPDDGSY